MRRPQKAHNGVEAVPKKTTIRDVARAASVGIGTISRVLNSSSQVSRQTRARVLEAIRRLGFRPNAQARRILKRRSEIVRSEEHTSELQSRFDLVCRLLLEKKKSRSTSTAGSGTRRSACAARSAVRASNSRWVIAGSAALKASAN